MTRTTKETQKTPPNDHLKGETVKRAPALIIVSKVTPALSMANHLSQVARAHHGGVRPHSGQGIDCREPFIYWLVGG